jgi:uncharacterized membrane protein
MSEQQNAAVAVYDSHEQAERAVRELQEAGIDMKSISIVAKDPRVEEQVVGYYNTGDRMKYWGKMGAFWGAFWGLLWGAAFFALPGVGPVLVAGPLVAWIVSGLEGAVVVGGLSAIGGALASIGIPKDSVIKYETAIKNDKYLLMVHGAPDMVKTARDVIARTDASMHAVHNDVQPTAQELTSVG